ncbi:Dyp-type peroxidase [Streptomyces sp. XH2]|uniref:Dyp-type peroxidase n=1 Tax=Streptomyces sp. XH2 TaxID=3412483 RepID=UPI003C7B7024
MPVDLKNPLSWKNATGDADTMLQNLQANILKGHVRDHLGILLLQFDKGPEDPTEARTFLTRLAPLMKSAKTHLQEVKDHKQNGSNGASDTDTSPYVGVGLTKDGYLRLGLSEQAIDEAFEDEAFKRGMKGAHLKDPPTTQWEDAYQKEIHAIVLVGGADPGSVDAKLQEIEGLRTSSISVIGRETGLGLRDAAGRGIEHFGYVDGRSQPLFLKEDLEEEESQKGGTSIWDPKQPLERVLVEDRLAPNKVTDFGSYFVLRKLEQNVRAFRQAEDDLANALNLKDGDRERAGAMLVGRFKDGTPLTLEPAPGAHVPVTNNFTYADDAGADKCPFQAHIRKTNPRGSGDFESDSDESTHLMARRGQTYGERSDGDLPESGVGLLFMAFNSSLLDQFEFTQKNWVNFADFPAHGSEPRPGLDQVIGQGDRPPATWPQVWGEEEGKEVPAVAQAVTMKGGEYFFMPSLPFLRSL